MEDDVILTCPVCGGKVELDEDGVYSCTQCYCDLTVVDGKLELRDD